MKRVLVFVLMAALLLPGCQSTPKVEYHPTPIQLDMAQMIEKAQDAPRNVNFSVAAEKSDSLYERLGAPQTYETKLTPKTDKLSVTVNAAVELPKTNAMPVAKVKPVQFTQQQATSFFDALRDGAVLYDTGRTGFTRAELDENIKMWQSRATGQELESAQDAPNSPRSTPRPQNEVYPYQDKAKAMWEYLEAERALEPEDIEATRSSAKLREMVFSFGKPDLGRYMGVRAVEKPSSFYEQGKQFTVRNDMAVMDWSDENIDWGEEIGARMEYSNPGADNRNPAAQGSDGWLYTRITEETAVPAKAKGSLTTTPAQARAQADPIYV